MFVAFLLQCDRVPAQIMVLSIHHGGLTRPALPRVPYSPVAPRYAAACSSLAGTAVTEVHRRAGDSESAREHAEHDPTYR